VGALDPERDQAIVESVAAACRETGCPLLGGETAEHPGVMPTDAVDLAGAVMGVVERGSELRPDRVSEDDLVIGLLSPNLRSNGFSLVRAVFGDEVDDHMDVLLEPSVLYAPKVLAALEGGGINAAAHITGGGLVGNLGRALPPGLGASVDTTTWDRPRVFDLVGDRGVPEAEMWATFNMGIGFCVIVDPGRAEQVIESLAEHSARVIGHVSSGDGVTLQ
jgi:phosphoribosylformylglycinamidine cyclo-ligase